ncbi:hypothetical protein [Pacificoceanicola onchidii]|uniref:hypothetical protein n=1 Tax=Pacificoceanicola onchidii TaxID=2562685 RepID=UPI001455E5F5|nr:hypothetical protein [Pacificoceanicola onchidii]
MSLYTPLKSGPALAPEVQSEADGTDSAALLAQIRRNEAALSALRAIKHGPHPDERIIQANIARLRQDLMHPKAR